MKNDTIKKTMDNIAINVAKNTEAIKHLATKDEFSEFKDENFQRFDKAMDILMRLDQERLFTFEAVQNIEKEISRQRREIDKIKEVLKIA